MNTAGDRSPRYRVCCDARCGIEGGGAGAGTFAGFDNQRMVITVIAPPNNIFEPYFLWNLNLGV